MKKEQAQPIDIKYSYIYIYTYNKTYLLFPIKKKNTKNYKKNPRQQA